MPINPSTPPRIRNPSSLPMWNKYKGFLPPPSSVIVVLNERMSPPTIARQLDKEAMIPSKKLVTGEIVPPIPKLRMFDFCKRKKSARKSKPIGIACMNTRGTNPSSFIA